ncbi:MAG: cupin domain-containing protein [Actinocatenispora sp.]
MFENYSVDLFDTLIHLREGGEAVPTARRNPKRAGHGDTGLWTLTAFHADSDRAVHADVWERHPSGHEVLCALNGELRVYLRDHGDGTVPVATLTPGRSFIVPAGQWHRLAVVEPGDLLVVTPRDGTEHERVDAAGRRS